MGSRPASSTRLWCWLPPIPSTSSSSSSSLLPTGLPWISVMMLRALLTSPAAMSPAQLSGELELLVIIAGSNESTERAWNACRRQERCLDIRTNLAWMWADSETRSAVARIWRRCGRILNYYGYSIYQPGSDVMQYHEPTTPYKSSPSYRLNSNARSPGRSHHLTSPASSPRNTTASSHPVSSAPACAKAREPPERIRSRLRQVRVLAQCLLPLVSCPFDQAPSFPDCTPYIRGLQLLIPGDFLIQAHTRNLGTPHYTLALL